MPRKAQKKDELAELFALPGQDEALRREAASDDVDKKTEEPWRSEIGAIRTEMSQALGALTAALQRSAPAPVQAPAQTEPLKLDINLNGLPNPQEDLDGFMKEYAKRTAEAVTSYNAALTEDLTAEAQAQVRQNAEFNRVWMEFKSANPAIAAVPPLVEQATRNTRARLQARGLDPDKFMFESTAEFNELVAGEARGIISSAAKDMGLTASPDVDNDEPAGGGDVDRSGGIPGGNTFGASRKTAEKQLPSMIDDLKAEQKRLGIV